MPLNASSTPAPGGTVLVTGGAGFIGSALVRRLVDSGRTVVNVDKLTYAGNLDSLRDLLHHPRHHLEQVDICDAAAVQAVFARHRPSAVMHLAAESHVDRSIDGPAAFVQTNVTGTFVMLDAARGHFESLPPEAQAAFRFVHVSTDEVFGSLPDTGRFTTSTPYDPRSPYSASKAASDHLVRAWGHTYGLPVVVTNCSNNYGPRQFPEKLIPLMILTALEQRPLPVYGDGSNVRDWIFVDDHASGLIAALERGQPGRTYLFGGDAERRNIDVVRAICALLDELQPSEQGSHEQLITFVTDRPGHDFRYAIDSGVAREDLGWKPLHDFGQGLRETVIWYLANDEWCERVQSGAYRRERLGLLAGS
jgi:dTDP-glucose 4,6-dehydratase